MQQQKNDKHIKIRWAITGAQITATQHSAYLNVGPEKHHFYASISNSIYVNTDKKYGVLRSGSNRTKKENNFKIYSWV